MSRHLGWWLVAVLLLVGAAGWMVVTKPARLGLDRRGGAQIVLEAKDSPGRHLSEHQVDEGTLAAPWRCCVGGSTSSGWPSRSCSGRGTGG